MYQDLRLYDEIAKRTCLHTRPRRRGHRRTTGHRSRLTGAGARFTYVSAGTHLGAQRPAPRLGRSAVTGVSSQLPQLIHVRDHT